MTLEEAKEQYPKWYERRIERGQKATGQRTGKSSKKLYAWFLRVAEDNAETIEPGVLEALAAFACKAHICENPNDKRIQKRIAEGKTGAKLYDWWNVNQVKNNSKEKTAHPCQMPL